MRRDRPGYFGCPSSGPCACTGECKIPVEDREEWRSNRMTRQRRMFKNMTRAIQGEKERTIK